MFISNTISYSVMATPDYVLTIYVNQEIKDELDKLKIIEEEPYYKVVKRLIESFKKNKQD